MSEALKLWARRIADALALEPGTVFVDAGAGSGVLTSAVAELSGARAIAVDPEPRPQLPGIERLTAFAERLPLKTASVHGILFSHTLHHMTEPRKAVAEAKRVLKPGGRIAIRTATHADLRANPHAKWYPTIQSAALAVTPDIGLLAVWIRDADLDIDYVETVTTPFEGNLADYEQSVVDLAVRDWALAPRGHGHPEQAARQWVRDRFTRPPDVQETLIVALHP